MPHPKSDHDKALLCKGLRFAPPPDWSLSIENAEWLNVQQHVRRTEWSAVLGEKNVGTLCCQKIENSQVLETRKWQNR